MLCIILAAYLSRKSWLSIKSLLWLLLFDKLHRKHIFFRFRAGSKNVKYVSIVCNREQRSIHTCATTARFSQRLRQLEATLFSDPEIFRQNARFLRAPAKKTPSKTKRHSVLHVLSTDITLLRKEHIHCISLLTSPITSQPDFTRMYLNVHCKK